MTIVEASDESTREAVRVLDAGGLVALPTETVYGLAGDAANGEAVARIFAAKGRPRFNPLICHVSGIEMARRYGDIDERAARLAEKFWPGPLTIVVPLKGGAPVHPLATSGLASVALRAPAGIAAKVIAGLGRAVAAPSANRSGRLSPTNADHVAAQFGADAPLILDGGPCPVGVESTIVSFLGARPRLLRAGGLDAAAIESVLGTKLERGGEGEGVVAPGMLKSHYAPNLPLRLEAEEARAGEAYLGFGVIPDAARQAVAALDLSPSGDLVEAAANLFAYLDRLDRSGAEAIAVAPVPREGLGEAINDRLERGAAGKGEQTTQPKLEIG